MKFETGYQRDECNNYDYDEPYWASISFSSGVFKTYWKFQGQVAFVFVLSVTERKGQVVNIKDATNYVESFSEWNPSLLRTEPRAKIMAQLMSWLYH